MSNLYRFFTTLQRVLITGIFSILVVCVVWQVFSRYVLNTPSTVTDELARFLFIWLALLGAAYTLGQKRHLAIDFIGSSLPDEIRCILGLVITLLIAGFAGLVMVYGGTIQASNILASGQISPTLQIPMGYIYLALPLSGLLMIFYCISFIIEILQGHSFGPNLVITDDERTPTAPAQD